jgi:hypothetical protein
VLPTLYVLCAKLPVLEGVFIRMHTCEMQNASCQQQSMIPLSQASATP